MSFTVPAGQLNFGKAAISCALSVGKLVAAGATPAVNPSEAIEMSMTTATRNGAFFESRRSRAVSDRPCGRCEMCHVNPQ